MVFKSANFIKPYLSTDKFLTILYPDGKRFVTLNAIQNKKIVLNGKKVRAYQEGQVPNTMPFLTEVDAQAAFQLLTDAIETLKANGNTGGGNPSPGTSGVIRLPKDDSVTIADVGKLMMQKTILLELPPDSLEDIDSKIFVADTTPGTDGTKGVWEFSFQHDPPLPPTNQIIRLTFTDNINPVYWHTWNFGDGGSLRFFEPGISTNLSEGQIELGATLEDTILVIEDYFALSTNLTNNVSLSGNGTDGTGHRFLEFTFHMGQSDTQYTLAQTITFGYGVYSGNFPAGFTNETNINFTFWDINNNPIGYLRDFYGNEATLTTETSANIDGFVKVISIESDTAGLIDTSSGVENDMELYFKDNALWLYHLGNYNQYSSFIRLIGGNWIIDTGIINFNATIPNVFPIYRLVEEYYTTSYIQNLTPDRVQIAQSLYSSVINNSYIIDVSTWDSTNGGQAILTYADLFSNNSLIPYGVIGPFNIRYYANSEDWLDAINWCFANGTLGTNNTKPSNAFAEMFDIVQVLQERISSPPDIYMRVQSKTAPSSSYTNAGFMVGSSNNYAPNATTLTIIEPIVKLPERITSTLVGVLVGVDGTDALISDGQFMKLKLCSVLDGANGIIPYTEETPSLPWVIAWRDGTVIDYSGFINTMQNAGFSGQAILYWLYIDGIYTTVTGNLPDGEIWVKKGANPFFEQ